MNLSLPPGAECVELHFHADAYLSLREAGEPPEVSVSNPPSGPSALLRWFAVGLVIAAGFAVGYGVGSRGPAASSQFASVSPSAHAVPRSVLAYPAPTANPVQLPQPDSPTPARDAAIDREPARSPGEIPPAIIQQLAQPPVVTPAPSAPRPAPNGSAFGLEN